MTKCRCPVTKRPLTFESFVRAERELLAQLTDMVGEHEAMLDQMR